MGRLEELEDRFNKLEFQLVLIRECLDSDIKPFNYLALENSLTESEYRQILDLMDKADQSIREGTPMGHGEFEQRVSKIVPSRVLDYHFAELIVSTLYREGKWEAVYKHMKEDGMNI